MSNNKQYNTEQDAIINIIDCKMTSMLTGMHCTLAETSRQRSKERRGQAEGLKHRMSAQTGCSQNDSLML